MAITQSVLTSGGSATDAQSYDTASVTPTADKPVIVAVLSRIGSGTNTSTVSLSGCNLTWTEIRTKLYGPTSQAKRITVFRGVGASPSNGPITISITGSGNNRCCWGVVQLDGDIDASDPVVQSADNSTDGSGAPFTTTVTLSALGDASNNAVIAFFANDDDASTFTEGSGYTELFDVVPGSSEDARLEGQWKVPGTTTPNVSSSASFTDVGGIAVELRYAAAAGGTVINRTLSESVASTDGFAGYRERNRKTIDAALVADGASRLAELFRLREDNPRITDAVGRASELFRLGADSAQLTELLQRSAELTRLLRDDPTVSDELVRQLEVIGAAIGFILTLIDAELIVTEIAAEPVVTGITPYTTETEIQ